MNLQENKNPKKYNGPKIGSKVRNIAGQVIGHVIPPTAGLEGTAHQFSIQYTPEVEKMLTEMYGAEKHIKKVK
jgi:hypothetical protein